MLWTNNPLARSLAASIGFLTFTLLYLCFVSPRWVLEESSVMHDDSFLTLVVRTSDVTQKQRLQLVLDTWILAVDRENTDDVIVTSSSPVSLSSVPLADGVTAATPNWKRVKFLESNCSSSKRNLNQCCQLGFGLTMAISSSSTWTCHFDDDSFVNLFQLKAFLFSLSQSTQANPDFLVYVGRNSVSTPMSFKPDEGGHPHYFYFATGGAGICLNRNLHHKLLPFLQPNIFTSLCRSTALSDDMLLGYLVSKHFNTKLTISNRFHSHLESLSAIEPQFLDQQISLSYDAQSNNLLEVNSFSIPDTSNYFSNEDITGFKWLTCLVYGKVGNLNCPAPNITQSSA